MKKGSFGYLNWKKKISILIAAVLVAMVMVVYFGALRYFGTNRNVFSLLAALMCLPAGKAVVDVVMYVRAKGCSDAEVYAHAGAERADLHERDTGLRRRSRRPHGAQRGGQHP